jgi:hypothetical protein
MYLMQKYLKVNNVSQMCVSSYFVFLKSEKLNSLGFHFHSVPKNFCNFGFALFHIRGSANVGNKENNRTAANRVGRIQIKVFLTYKLQTLAATSKEVFNNFFMVFIHSAQIKHN